jgi:hypothetical protein
MDYGSSRVDEGTYAMRLDVTTDTFTARYLSSAWRGYIPADNETHFALAEMQGNSSFILRKSDLSYVTCESPGSPTGALWAAGFDENSDIWWGLYDTARNTNWLYRLHTDGCKWQSYQIPLGVPEGHPYFGIQGGMVNSTIWFMKEGNGYLASYNIHTGEYAEYKVAPASYPSVRMNAATVDYVTQTIWITGYGSGEIFRFSMSNHSLTAIDVSGIIGTNPVGILLYASRYLLITTLSSTMYVWDTTEAFSPTSVGTLIVPGTTNSNLGGPSLSAGPVIANNINIMRDRFTSTVTKIYVGQPPTTSISSITSSTSSSPILIASTNFSQNTIHIPSFWFVGVIILGVIGIATVYAWRRHIAGKAL